jgi:hypothetical protein
MGKHAGANLAAAGGRGERPSALQWDSCAPDTATSAGRRIIKPPAAAPTVPGAAAASRMTSPPRADGALATANPPVLT